MSTSFILLVLGLKKLDYIIGTPSAFDIHQNKMYCFSSIVAYQFTPKLKWL